MTSIILDSEYLPLYSCELSSNHHINIAQGTIFCQSRP
jgi:hypothetical protein